MTRIGAGWIKHNEETGKFTTQIRFDEALMPLTITPDKLMILKTNENKTEDKHPDYLVDLFIPKKKN